MLASTSTLTPTPPVATFNDLGALAQQAQALTLANAPTAAQMALARSLAQSWLAAQTPTPGNPGSAAGNNSPNAVNAANGTNPANSPPANIQTLAGLPGMAYLGVLALNPPINPATGLPVVVNWEGGAQVAQSWNQRQQGLTLEGAAIVSLAVAFAGRSIALRSTLRLRCWLWVDGGACGGEYLFTHRSACKRTDNLAACNSSPNPAAYTANSSTKCDTS